MSIIIRLQNLPWAANALDIRQYFSGLQIPEGGVHIVGGELGDAFIAFSTDEDARQAFLRNDGKIKGIQIKLLLSSRTEMQRVIEQARTQSMAAFMLPAATPSTTQMPAPVPAAVPAIVPASVPEIRKDNGDEYSEKKRERRRSRSKSRERRDKSRDRRERRRDRGRSKSREKREKRRGRSKESKTRSRDRDRGSRRDKGRNSDNRDLDRDEKKPQDIWMNRHQPAQPTLNIIPPPGIIQNDVPSLLGPWGFGSAAKTNVVAALAANLQARTVNGFQPPQQDRPRPLMETRYGDDWSNPNPPLLNEPYGFRNRLDFSANLNQRNSRDGFEPPRRLFDQEDESNGDFRGSFGSRGPQPDLRAEMNAKKSRFEPPFKENSFGGRKSRFEDAEGPPVNACVSLEPFDGSYGDLRRFFSKLPINYRGIKVINDEYGQKTGMCYVQFREERVKVKALEMDGMQFNGEKVSIRHISDKEYEDAIDRYNPKMDELDAPSAGGRNNKMVKKTVENSPEIQDFTCLKVEGLPTIIKEQDILHIFSQYPLICLIMDVKPKGGTVAYVKFGNQEVAKQALKERVQHVINGKSVAVKPCSNEEFDVVNQKLPNLFKEKDQIVSDCLLITNLPVKSNDRDISDFFSDIGLIPTKIHLISNSEGFTGQAYCEFESVEEAAKAAAKDETLMGPNKVSVKLLLREDMERVLNSSLPHPGLGPGETLAPGTPLPPIQPEAQTEKESPVGQQEEEPMHEEGKFEHPQFPPRPLLTFIRPGYPGARFSNKPNFEMPRGRFDPNLGPRGHFSRGGTRGKFEPRGFRGRGGRFPPPRGGRFVPPSHRADTPPRDVQPGCTVYMDNVPFKAGTNEILDFFDGYNCTNEVSRMYNNDHTPSALAKVTFYSPEDAERAVRELNGEKIWNRPITLTQE